MRLIYDTIEGSGGDHPFASLTSRLWPHTIKIVHILFYFDIKSF
jgi:hypothetical protein